MKLNSTWKFIINVKVHFKCAMMQL